MELFKGSLVAYILARKILQKIAKLSHHNFKFFYIYDLDQAQYIA